MPNHRAGYDSPTQCGDYDDYSDSWDRYDYGDETDTDSDRDRHDRDSLHEWNERCSPSFQPPRSDSSVSFSVLSADFPPLGSQSPEPIGDAVFSPVTPSNGLEEPSAPLPSLHEWFMTGQPLYSILTLPANDTNDSPPANETNDSLPANDTNYSPPANYSSAIPSTFGVLLHEPSPAIAIAQQSAAVTDAPSPDVHSLTLSQFFDEQAAQEISAALADYQRSEDPGPEEAAGFEAEEPEERFFLREEDIHLNAIRDRSVLEMTFASEMPPPDASSPPEEDPAAAPQPGYVPPEEFEPAYAHPPYTPPMNEGRVPYSSEPFSYLATALQMHEAQLKCTVAHLTALSPTGHVSITGTTYADYLRNQCGFTVSDEYKNLPMLELGDHFLAPLESLVLYWHV